MHSIQMMQITRPLHTGEPYVDVKHVVFEAVDEVNQMLPREKRIPKSLDTVLVGASAAIDSLALVNLIVEVEQRISEAFHSTLNLADQRSAGPNQKPLQTIGALVEYLNHFLAAERGA